jgi:hypothetical protein
MIDGTYALSRIFAKGWAAARATPANDDMGNLQERAATLNPYTKDPEKSRWCAGYVAALER